ncbi:hypothetical protein CAPTEDRAFT_227995 [Capitella teleta]|uniref:EGF-like domain-containing protein n=1 Tax=Capitella teleta TaxID=283909 RepID=R7VGB6_CAPTE|nr:hypothetical protein CAPTEDRAFT_227995 [Capitella teleta]|eukprot:ELU17888.1 hypothetical protein CAPTEDRAFT_227995 [Capitella teleta]
MSRQRSVLLQQIALLCLILSIALYLYARLSSAFFYQLNSSATEGSFERNASPKRILVTGGAGFIGFHLAKALAANKKNVIVALDNFNDYYDVKLKIDRAYELHQLGVTVHNDDVCNADFLHALFIRHKFTHVAHLAAQAGVRYSLQNPLAYIRANVECQVALLDVLRSFKDVKLVYASSSSVYGKESEVPFSLRAHTDRPGNMYAASKKTDELLGYHYCHAYNISAVGLRFFTVYGPWGRPDMAVYKFAESMLDGKEVPLYEDSSDPIGLGRDFTYIEDIVQGTLASLDYVPSECGERFNLGFGNPVSLPEMLNILQHELNVTAKIKKSPLPPTEILRTWADLSTSTQMLGFRPETALRLGIKKFVVWYKGYRLRRKDQDERSLPSPSATWFRGLLAEKKDRAKRSGEDSVKRHNEELQRRMQHQRNKYYEWAKQHDIEVSELDKSQFSFFQGLDSSGNDLIRMAQLKNDIEGLKAACREMVDCLAFNSEGVLKRQVREQVKWEKVPFFQGEHQGLYVANVNPCKANLHDCAKYAQCTPILPAQYSCRCKQGYFGNGKLCLPRYAEVDPKELQWEYAADVLSIHNVTRMKEESGQRMVFFQGLDSPNGDYLVADKYRGDLEKLKEICIKDPICIAVNTNGLMKRRIADKSTWTLWTNDPQQGLYVFDIDYCSLAAEACPEHARCTRVSAGHFTCVCHPPYSLIEGECIVKQDAKAQPVLKPEAIVPKTGKPNIEQAPPSEKSKDISQNIEAVLPVLKAEAITPTEKEPAESSENSNKPSQNVEAVEDTQNVEAMHFNVKATQFVKLPKRIVSDFDIHIIHSVDNNDLLGIPTLVNSLVKHTNQSLHIHIVVCNLKPFFLLSLLKCFSFHSEFKLSIVPFDVKRLNDGYLNYMQRPGQGLFDYLSNCANYARFFFYELLPDLEVAIYMDTDIVLQSDIKSLWNRVTKSPHTITAIERSLHPYKQIFSPDTAVIFSQRYTREMDMEANSYNAGVFAVNLTRWRQRSKVIEDDLQFWMKQNVDKDLWKMGTQPLMLLTFHQDSSLLPAHFHLPGLGWKTDISPKALRNASILHWSGSRKPWRGDQRLYYSYWKAQSPLECRGYGVCEQQEEIWRCVQPANSTQ